MISPSGLSLEGATDGLIWKEWKLTTKHAAGPEVRSTVAGNETGNPSCDVAKQDRARGNHKGALQQHPNLERATSTLRDCGSDCDKIDRRRRLNVVILDRSGQRGTEQYGYRSEKENYFAKCNHDPDRRSADRRMPRSVYNTLPDIPKRTYCGSRKFDPNR